MLTDTQLCSLSTPARLWQVLGSHCSPLAQRLLLCVSLSLALVFHGLSRSSCAQLHAACPRAHTVTQAPPSFASEPHFRGPLIGGLLLLWALAGPAQSTAAPVSAEFLFSFCKMHAWEPPAWSQPLCDGVWGAPSLAPHGCVVLCPCEQKPRPVRCVSPAPRGEAASVWSYAPLGRFPPGRLVFLLWICGVLHSGHQSPALTSAVA